MNPNPSRRTRSILYLIATFATPTLVYLSSTETISDAMTVLIGAYISLTLALATVNTITPQPLD